MANTIPTVTTKERLHKLVDELTEAEADNALLTLARSRKYEGVLEHERQQREIDEAIVASYAETPQEDLGALWATRQSIREEPWSRNAPS
jgi:acetyl-CoA carboxylase beta subunit